MATRFFPNYKANLIISQFGMRKHPITKINKMHNGIDINATNDGRTGQTDYITAHTGGTVEAVGYGVSAGNYVKIRVDPKTLMAYYHMKNPCTLKKGATVKKGDRVGYVGKTGSATGPHLHFGIQYNGAWIDPEPYLDKDWAQPVKMVAVDLPVLKKGAKGEEVKALQTLLNLRLADSKDWTPLSADGSFGGKTLDAVIRFQTMCGLEPDGSVGKATWMALIGGAT